MIASDRLRDRLVRTDEEFRHLSERHQELEMRLAELSRHLYHSAPEEWEKVDLKKKKLQLKDQMERRLKSHRDLGLTTASSVPTGLCD